VDGGPDTHEREQHDVDYLRLTPLHRSWRPWKRKADKERGYKHTGAPNLRPGEENVVYVRRQRFHMPWWQRFLGGIIALGLVIVAAGTVFVLTQRNRTTVVTLDQAVESFKTEERPTTVTPPPAPTAAATSHGVAARSGAVADTKAVDPKAATAAPLAEAKKPAEGVYSYATSGSEEISVFGARHEYPSRTFATVRHLDGCLWEHRNEVIKEHVDTTVGCNQADRLLLMTQERRVEFFGTKDGALAYCKPPLPLHIRAEKVGTKVVGTCNSSDGTAEATLTRTFLGIEQMTIGGEKVSAVHIEIDSVFKGRANGTAMDELWFAEDTGAVLRWERTVDTKAKAFGTDVRYQEEATFLLESLSPKR
jgi:hypothetical protein